MGHSSSKQWTNKYSPSHGDLNSSREALLYVELALQGTSNTTFTFMMEFCCSLCGGERVNVVSRKLNPTGPVDNLKIFLISWTNCKE